jgi:hypothetical protein
MVSHSDCNEAGTIGSSFIRYFKADLPIILRRSGTSSTLFLSFFLSFFLSSNPYLFIAGVEDYCYIWSHSMTHTHSIGSLWTRDRPVGETSTWQHTIFTRDRYRCPGGIRIRNPRKPGAADPRLRPHGHRDLPSSVTKCSNVSMDFQK